ILIGRRLNRFPARNGCQRDRHRGKRRTVCGREHLSADRRLTLPERGRNRGGQNESACGEATPQRVHVAGSHDTSPPLGRTSTGSARVHSWRTSATGTLKGT